MGNFATLSIEENIATVTLDSSDDQVNILGPDSLTELDQLAEQLAHTDPLSGVILCSGKSGGFIAGADIDLIAEVTDPATGEKLATKGQAVFNKWAALPSPVIALLHGHCMGGGTELALACDYRLAGREMKIGLPEVKLGILPGFGGTQRLPPLVGMEAALDMILSGRTLSADQALASGLIDMVTDKDLLFDDAKRLLLNSEQLRKFNRRRNMWSLRGFLLEHTPPGRALIFSQARKAVLRKTGSHYPAPLKILEILQQTRSLPIADGLRIEARSLGELIVTKECKNLVHVFHLSQRAKKTLPHASSDSLPRQVAVVGAGVMGGGIASLLASRNIPVRLKDIKAEAVAAGIDQASKLLSKRSRGQSTNDVTKQLTGQLDYRGFSTTEIVIEAIVEQTAIKQVVIQEVEAEIPESAIIASNTSALSISDLQKVASRPGRVAGLHFFNPVDKMPLVEVIAGTQTDKTTIDALVALAIKLGKIPIIVADQPGFLVNRLLGVMLAEACLIVETGTSWKSLDQLAVEFGWAMGPFRLIDEVGIDIATEVGQTLVATFPYLKKTSLLEQMLARQLLGSKTGAGFYRYTKGHANGVNPHGWPIQTGQPASALDIRRLLLAMVNEAARCLESKVVQDPADVDSGLVFGIGFPPFLGGLCRWADDEGLGKLIGELQELAVQHGPRFNPAAYLAEHKSFYQPDNGAQAKDNKNGAG
jgi:3-hydroxyacyl-CoA dehydrogenase / enoyl-CoA hydratase / 3-hydroxybutyryl-CoA epimerase